jgi:hypothetical protein
MLYRQLLSYSEGGAAAVEEQAARLKTAPAIFSSD